MTCFILSHLLDDRPRACIVMGKVAQVGFQMLANLFFGFGNKAKADLIAR
jgi:hypothetical protein